MIEMDEDLKRAFRQAARRFSRDLRRRHKERREKAHQQLLKDVRQADDQKPEQVAEALHRSFLAELPEMARRSKRLKTSLLTGASHQRVGRYLTEATRAFIRGDFNATIIVSRSAIEGALKQKLARPGRRVRRKDLEDLINRAEQEGKLTPALARKAHQVRRRGNKYTHARGGSRRLEDEAHRRLRDTKAILEQLFGAR